MRPCTAERRRDGKRQVCTLGADHWGPCVFWQASDQRRPPVGQHDISHRVGAVD